MKKYLSILIVVVITAGCGRLLVDPDPEGDALRNFEIFWSDMYNSYPYFNRDNVDWKAMYESNKNRLSKNSTRDDLFEVLKDMLRPLNDGHISLTIKNTNKAWSNEKYSGYYYQNYYGVYGRFKPAVKSKLGNSVQTVTYVNSQDPTKTDTVAMYGIIDNTYLYFHLQTYLTQFAYQKILKNLLTPNIKGLILDVRDNGGGNIGTMLNGMGIFFNRPTSFAYYKEKVGPLENDYAANNYYTIEPSAEGYFNLPIVLIANRFTFSAGEHTVLAMSRRANTTVIGDTTGGALSFINQRTLPNGIEYIAVTSQTLDMNNKLYEGLGIPPQVLVESNRQFYDAGIDPCLEEALKILQK